MPDAHNEFDIPVLTDVLVPGKAALARVTRRADAPPHATDLPDQPPEVAPGVTASGLAAVDAGRPLATAYDAPAEAAGADMLPVSRLAPGGGEAAPLAGGELGARPVTEPVAPTRAEAPFVAREPEAVPAELAAQPQPLESHHAAELVEPTQAEAPFVAHEPEPVPEELASAPQPIESHHEPEPVEPTQAEAQFVAHEPESVPPELAAQPQPFEPHHEAEAPFVAPEPEFVPQELAAEPQPLESHHAVEPTQAEAPFVAPEPEFVPRELAAEPQPLESHHAVEPTQAEAPFVAPEPQSVPQELAAEPQPLESHHAVEPTQAEAPFVTPEPEFVPQELAAEPQPLEPAHAEPAFIAPAPEQLAPQAAAIHAVAEALTPHEAAFISSEPGVPVEFASMPEPLALNEAPAEPPEPTQAEALFVATEPAVPQEFAAEPEPLPVHEPAPAAAEAEAPTVIHDDEHDTSDNDPLAYALNLPDGEAIAAPATHADATAGDLTHRTESARHRADALPPPAFAQLTPFDAATPVPSRFADIETPLPAELRHSETVVVPQPPPPKIDSRRIAERLQGRVSAYLSGEGRELIDARSREVVQQHAAWLVGEVSQQVVAALAPEIERWVGEAVDEAIAHRNAPTSEH